MAQFHQIPRRSTNHAVSVHNLEMFRTSRSAFAVTYIYSRYILRERYIDYWSKTLSSNMKDPAALWSKISLILNQPNVKSDCKVLADEFADHFRNKVSKFCIATFNEQPPVIQSRSCPVTLDIRPVSAVEISKIIDSSPEKHCSTDPAPTWLIKRLIPDLLRQSLRCACNL